MTRARQVMVPAVGAVAVLAVLGWLGQRFFADPTLLPPDDFLQYWAAGRLLRDGGNPYDANHLLAVQASTGRPDPHPVLMWNPPWALPLVGPFGLLPWRTGQLVWLALQLLLLAGSVGWLWGLAGGPTRWRGAAAAGALSFFPVHYLLHAGQSGGWLVLGMAGLAASGRHPGFAALAAAAAVKPHLLVPVWAALALDATRSRHSRAVLGWGVAAGVGLALAPLLADAGVWTEYLAALRRPPTATHTPLSLWRCPTVGWWLRQAVAPDWFWLQWTPTAVGLLVTIVYWWRRAVWDWGVELPRLVLAGLLCSPYGAWPFDLVLLLVPLTATAAALVQRADRRTLWLAAGAWVGLLALGNVSRVAENFVWVTPVVAVAYWLVDRRYGAGFRAGGR